MKKALKITVSLFLTLILVLGFTGGMGRKAVCEAVPASPADPSLLIGRWNAIAYLCRTLNMTEDEILSICPDIVCWMDFSEDGKVVLGYTMSGMSDQQEMTYAVSGSILIVDDEDHIPWEIEDGCLILYDNGRLVLPRAKEKVSAFEAAIVYDWLRGEAPVGEEIPVEEVPVEDPVEEAWEYVREAAEEPTVEPAEEAREYVREAAEEPAEPVDETWEYVWEAVEEPAEEVFCPVEEGMNIEGIYNAADINEDALLANGWTVMSEEEGTALMDDDMKALFAGAFQGFVGASYTAEEVIAAKALEDGSVIYLFRGTQTLVLAEPVTKDGFSFISIVTDADGSRTAIFLDFFACDNVSENR